MIIFLDESGDLGFDFDKPKTSRKFVIALLVCEGYHATDNIRKAVRRTLKNKLNRNKNNKRMIHELKGTNTKLAIKKYFFRQLASEGWQVYTVILNKLRVNEDLQQPRAKKKLYNFLARFIIEKIDLSNARTAVTLIIDRSKNKEEVKDFNRYVENQLEALLPLNVPLHIYHERSHENVGLQAVDLFCWGIFRKYEKGERDWYDTYSRSIVFETEYLR